MSWPGYVRTHRSFIHRHHLSLHSPDPCSGNNGSSLGNYWVLSPDIADLRILSCSQPASLPAQAAITRNPCEK